MEHYEIYTLWCVQDKFELNIKMHVVYICATTSFVIYIKEGDWELYNYYTTKVKEALGKTLFEEGVRKCLLNMGKVLILHAETVCLIRRPNAVSH